MTQRNVQHGRQPYEDFSGGDYGITHPRKAPENTFHGKNVVIYKDGTIGPRNGLVPVTLTGMPNGALNAFFFGVEHEVATPRMVYSQGVRPGYFLAETFGTQAVANFTGPGGTPDPFEFGDEPDGGVIGVLPRLAFNSYFSVLGDRLYMLNNLSDEIDAVGLTGLPYGSHDVVEYLDRLYAIGIGDAASGRGHKVQYSGRADATSWSVENIFAVGYAWVIFRAFKFQNGLLIIAQDQSWYMLTGSPVTGQLRRLAHGRGPELTSQNSVVVDRDRAWFMASGAPGGAFPATFDGTAVDTVTLAHLRDWISGSEHIGSTLNEADDDLMFVGAETHRALMRNNGVWTRHEFEADVGEWVTPYADQRFFIAIDGDEDSPPSFYRSRFDLDGPPIADGEWYSPGDGDTVPFDAWFELPELWQPDGSLHRPMHVLVEFTSYDTGATLDAHFEVEVDIKDRFGQESVQTVSAGVWDESQVTVASTEDGVRRRFIARAIPATAPGAGLQLRVKDIRGVKFERIVLDFELSDGLDRA